MRLREGRFFKIRAGTCADKTTPNDRMFSHDLWNICGWSPFLAPSISGIFRVVLCITVFVWYIMTTVVAMKGNQ